MSGSSSSSAGEGGATGSGGEVAAPITIGEVVGQLDGFVVQQHLVGNVDFQTSLVRLIVNGTYVDVFGGRLDKHFDYPIGGTPGATYQVSLHFYGIVEPRNYGPSVERESGATRPVNLDTGAEPAPWAVAEPGVEIPATPYFMYELRVFDEAMKDVGGYLLNSDTTQGFYTYVLNFERTIPVIGGGVVRIRLADENVLNQKNCGANPRIDDCGSRARSIDLGAADPQPPPPFKQPGLGSTLANAPQWIMIDVTRVEPL